MSPPLSSQEAQNKTMSVAERTPTSRLCSGSTMSHYKKPGFPAKLPNPRLGEAHGNLDSTRTPKARTPPGPRREHSAPSGETP